MEKKRIAVLVSYDKDGMIDDYIPYMIRDLQECVERIVVVFNGSLQPNSRKKLLSLTLALACAVSLLAGCQKSSDQPGGSTLGSISNTKVPLMTVDIGMAQLAMHSAYETAGCADCDHLERAMTAFYGMTLRCEADGRWRMTGTRT